MYSLRELSREDIPTINKWRNAPELISNLGAPFRYINSDVEYAWYDNYLKQRNSTVRCSVVDENDRCLGLVSLTAIDYLNRTATLHIMIGDVCNRGKGIGSFAVREMLNHAFANLNLNRVELGVLESNTAAIHLYEKCGFVREGIKRNSIYKAGRYVNLLIYAILRDDFYENN